MPLGEFEREVLRLIARNRNPDSFIAGATVLHQLPTSPRASRDVDVFHDTMESLARSVEVDTALLRAGGYEVDLVQMRLDWLGMVTEAEALLEKLPPGERGCLYLDATGKPACPDPSSPEFPTLTRHYGSIKGAWPRIVES